VLMPHPCQPPCQSMPPPMQSSPPPLQVLFYVRLVGDILGRQVPPRWQARTVPQLLTWALVKTAMVCGSMLMLM
jgi:hypothetical protein